MFQINAYIYIYVYVQLFLSIKWLSTHLDFFFYIDLEKGIPHSSGTEKWENQLVWGYLFSKRKQKPSSSNQNPIRFWKAHFMHIKMDNTWIIHSSKHWTQKLTSALQDGAIAHFCSRIIRVDISGSQTWKCGCWVAGSWPSI